ncbi:MAG TPA: hypothetical protein VNW28_04965, partial [Chthoniobacterales bacterium]|nr:hypothetical protein [Chthoniobacterales bacterium]
NASRALPLREGPDEQTIIDDNLAPKDGRESAVIMILEPNAAYTVVVRGVGDTTGVALVEVYNLQ